MHSAKQIQGLCAYFYDSKHPNTAVELNRCVYNQMVDAPRKNGKCIAVPKGRGGGEGRNGNGIKMEQEEDYNCEDCRSSKIEEVMTAHFCQPCGKPWECMGAHTEENKGLCHDLRREWFRIRKDLEGSDFLKRGDHYVPTNATGTFEVDTYMGYCDNRKYIPLRIQ